MASPAFNAILTFADKTKSENFLAKQRIYTTEYL